MVRQLICVILALLSAAHMGQAAAADKPDQLAGQAFLEITSADVLNEKGARAKVNRLVSELRAKAEAGDKYCQYRLGNLYWLDMQYLKKDIPESVKWLTKSANQGFSDAQNRLGEMYDHIGGPGLQNSKTAFQWFDLAAKQNNRDAQFNLAGQHYRGIGVPRNYEKSFEYMSSAAEGGHVRAQLMLSVMYALGNGVAKDLDQTLKWASIATASGNREAAATLEKDEKGFPEHVAQGQKLAAEWWATHPAKRATP